MYNARVFVEKKTFEDDDGAPVTFNQVMIEVAGVVVPIKSVFKDDKRMLVALASRKENNA